LNDLSERQKRDLSRVPNLQPADKVISCPICRTHTEFDPKKTFDVSFPKNTDFIALLEKYEAERRHFELQSKQLLDQMNTKEKENQLPHCPNHPQERADWICVDERCPHPASRFCADCLNELHASCRCRRRAPHAEFKVPVNTQKAVWDKFFSEQEEKVIGQCKLMQKRLLTFLGYFKQKHSEIQQSLSGMTLESYLVNKSKFILRPPVPGTSGEAVLESVDLVNLQQLLRQLEFGLSDDVLWTNVRAAEVATLALHGRKMVELFPAASINARELLQRLENTNKYLLQNVYLRDWNKAGNKKIESVEEWQSRLSECLDPASILVKPAKIIQCCGINETGRIQDIVKKALSKATSLPGFLETVRHEVRQVFGDEGYEWTCSCDPLRVFPRGEVLRYVQMAIAGIRVSVWAKNRPTAVSQPTT
jgi:hypothetical protein